jgi:hypothetical protein
MKTPYWRGWDDYYSDEFYNPYDLASESYIAYVAGWYDAQAAAHSVS